MPSKHTYLLHTLLLLMALLTAPRAGAQASSVGLLLTEDERAAVSAVIKEAMVQQEYDVRTTPMEKVFLHLDKPFYMQGDTIWYKAYALLAAGMTPDTLNRTLYVDFVEQDGRVAASSPVLMENGMARGQIAFEDTLTPGYYMVRAYTSWMRNFSDRPLFSALVPVYAREGDGQSRWLFTRRIEDGDGDSDTLHLHLMLSDKDFLPWLRKPFEFRLSSRQLEPVASDSETDDSGEADIKVSIPKQLRRSMATLHLAVRNGDGRKERADFTVSLQRNDSIVLAILPEGGRMLTGTEGVVAYRATDQTGTPVPVTGEVFASGTDSALVRFESSGDGTGRFRLRPEEGTAYTAVVRHADPQDGTRTFSFPLPAALDAGYAMEVDGSGEGGVTVRIRRRGVTGEKLLGLTVRSGGALTAGKVISVREDLTEVVLPRTQFRPGVSQVALFDEDYGTYCERSVFIDSGRPLRIEAAFDKPRYGKREKVTLRIRVTDAGGRPVDNASLSVSVTDRQLVSDTTEANGNILTHMLLTADLTGSVREPGRLFRTQDPTRDDLMLTSGWRRYDFSKPAAGYGNRPWKLEYALRIPGTVQNMTTGKGVDNVQVVRATGTLSKKSLSESRWLTEVRGWEYKFAMERNPADTAQTVKRDGWRIHEVDETRTDSTGRFLFYSSLQGEFMSVFATYKVKGRNERAVATDRTVNMLAPYDTLPGEPFLRHLDLHPEDMQRYLAQQRRQQAVQDLISDDVRAYQIRRDSLTTFYLAPAEALAPQEAAERYASQLATYRFDGKMASMEVINYNNFVYTPDIWQVLRHKYPDKIHGSTWEGRPIVIVDLSKNILPGDASNPDYRTIENVYVCTDEYARTKMYEYLKQYPVYWEAIFDMMMDGEPLNAVVVFYTRTQTVAPQIGIRKMLWNGYLKPAEFYSPDYARFDPDDPFDMMESGYDARSTLYWNPDVRTSSDGTAEVTFYNSDRCNAMHLDIQGMASSGEMGVLEK